MRIVPEAVLSILVALKPAPILKAPTFLAVVFLPVSQILRFVVPRKIVQIPAPETRALQRAPFKLAARFSPRRSEIPRDEGAASPASVFRLAAALGPPARAILKGFVLEICRFFAFAVDSPASSSAGSAAFISIFPRTPRPKPRFKPASLVSLVARLNGAAVAACGTSSAIFVVCGLIGVVPARPYGA